MRFRTTIELGGKKTEQTRARRITKVVAD